VPPKRDIIGEVISRRARHLKRIPRLTQTERRIYDLEGACYFLERHPDIPTRHKRELYRHVPVALIAITEGYCKMLYRDLIDSGEPFLSNAKQFKDVRLDIDALIATHSRAVTVGEIISHQLSHNNLGDIESNLSLLLAQDFPAEFTKRLQNEDLLSGHTIFSTHLRRQLVYTFRQRHIYCHELATTVYPRRYETETSIKVFRVFFHLLEEHISEATKRIS